MDEAQRQLEGARDRASEARQRAMQDALDTLANRADDLHDSQAALERRLQEAVREAMASEDPTDPLNSGMSWQEELEIAAEKRGLLAELVVGFIQGLPGFFDQQVAWLRRGLETGFVQPAYILPGVIAQIEVLAGTRAQAGDVDTQSFGGALQKLRVFSLQHATRIVALSAVLAAAFVSALAATALCKKVALRFGIVDRPDDLVKTHREPIAYLGGDRNATD